MAQRACTASVMAVCEEEMKRTLTSLSSVATSWMRLCTPGGGGGGGGVSSERASQEEYNGANFSFIAPSSEELWVLIRTCLPFNCMFGKGRHSSGLTKLQTLITPHLKVLCN